MSFKFLYMSRPRAAIIACTTLAVIGYFDNITGNKLALSAFYLLPITIITLNFSTVAGVFAAVISAIAEMLVHVLYRGFYYPPLIIFWNAGILMTIYIIISLLISSLKESIHREKENARKDFMTGIANFQAFIEQADRELAKATRFKRGLSMAYLDCDNFKEINDTLGHRAGDVVLRTVAEVLQSRVRRADVHARLGGDEFAILFTELHAPEAETAMNQIRNFLLEEMRKYGWGVTFSIGLVTFEAPPASVDSMISKAEEQMYRVKRTTQNAISHLVVRE